VAASRLLTDSIFDAWRHHCVMGLAAMLITLAGCGSGSDSATETPVSTRPVTQTDLEIAQLLYVDNRRTPQGFYQETVPSVSGYVATTHLKSTEVVSPSAPLYELCTDDWNTALAWSDQVASGTQASNLVETNTTTRYYEFGRVRAGTPPGYIRARVYRCTYLDRSSVDLSSAGTVAGQFNQRPLNAAELQQLSEYLWQFTTYNNYGHAVLKSSGVVANNNVEHTLIIASLTAANSGGCDRVRLIGWTHAVDSQTGALSLNAQALWDFGARRSAGVVEICNPN